MKEKVTRNLPIDVVNLCVHIYDTHRIIQMTMTECFRQPPKIIKVLFKAQGNNVKSICE